MKARESTGYEMTLQAAIASRWRQKLGNLIDVDTFVNAVGENLYTLILEIWNTRGNVAILLALNCMSRAVGDETKLPVEIRFLFASPRFTIQVVLATNSDPRGTPLVFTIFGYDKETKTDVTDRRIAQFLLHAIHMQHPWQKDSCRVWMQPHADEYNMKVMFETAISLTGDKNFYKDLLPRAHKFVRETLKRDTGESARDIVT